VLSYAPELVAVAVFDADIRSCLGTGFCRKCVLRVSHEFIVEGVRCHLQCVADRVQTTVADCFELVFFIIDPNLDLSDHAIVGFIVRSLHECGVGDVDRIEHVDVFSCEGLVYFCR